MTRAALRQRIDASPRYRWIVLATVLFGLFTVNFTVTILTVSIPRIARELDSSQSVLTWVVIGPILAFGIVGPAVGKLGDIHGQRRLYVAGMAGAAAMALCSALAWSAPSLIAFRVLGAVEGAATGPASFALIALVFGHGERVKALGYWSLVAAGGPVLGVVAGGPLVEAVGWRAIFAAQVPLALLGCLVAFVVLPETTGKADRRFDLAGAVLLALTATPLLWALNRGPEVGWTRPDIIAGFLIAPAALAAFVAVERRTPQPLLPLHYFRRRNVTFPITVQTLMHAAYMGSFVLTPLLLANLLDYTESEAGFVSIARPLAFAVTGVGAGYLTARIGERSAAMGGAAVLVCSMLWMASIDVGSTGLYIAGGLALAGIAAGLMSPGMAASVSHAVDQEDMGVAGAAQQMLIQVGIVIGIQVMQTVQLERVDTAGLAGSYHDAYMVGAFLAVAAFVAAAFVRPSARAARSSVDRAAVAVAEAEVPGREWGAPEGAPELVADELEPTA